MLDLTTPVLRECPVFVKGSKNMTAVILNKMVKRENKRIDIHVMAKIQFLSWNVKPTGLVQKIGTHQSYKVKEKTPDLTHCLRPSSRPMFPWVTKDTSISPEFQRYNMRGREGCV